MSAVSEWAEDADSDLYFWTVMAIRMEQAERSWWSQRYNLAVLRSVCAGAPLVSMPALWHRRVEDVCTGL